MSNATFAASPPSPRLPLPEFIALIAMLFATIAFSIDAMLPALPEISQQLTPSDPNKAQLIVTSFVLGMGIGTLFAGPLSDSFGRRNVILAGAALYCVASTFAMFAPSLETVLAARVVQGLGAAGPRVVSLALVRDLYKGREMARVVSFAMMVFSLVPAVAPLAASGIILELGWRAIFAAFILFALVAMAWMVVRQPETLPRAARRPLAAGPLLAALREVLTNRVVLTAIAVQTLCFGCLFGTLSSTQQLFDQTFARGESFPLWFALIAILASSASMINAALVVRLGMRRMVSTTLWVQVLLSGGFALAWGGGLLNGENAFPIYILWTTSVFMMAGLVLGNLNAIALEPLGHIAGMAASVSGAISTVLAVMIAAPLGLAFDGTPLPLAIGICVLSITGAALMLTLPRR